MSDEPDFGYAWDAERREREVGLDERRAHDAILEEMEEDDLLDLDLSRAGDYVVWAAAQAFEDLDLGEQALALLRRLAASPARHPALRYPEIALRLADRLGDRGEYDEALASVDRAAAEDPLLADACDERRAGILVLSGRTDEGLRLYERLARGAPDDPWIALAAAWALIQGGEEERASAWIERGNRAARRLEEEAEARDAAAEIDRLRHEARVRAARRRGEVGGAEERLLGELDAEERRLVREPPRSEASRAEAARRLERLRAAASRAWDDAVEAGDEGRIAAFDDLQWDIVGVAERFGITLPDSS